MFKRYYDIQSQGEKAYNGYLATVHNPYARESVEYSIWLLGWKQAEKRKAEEAKKHIDPRYLCECCGVMVEDYELRDAYRTINSGRAYQYVCHTCMYGDN